MKLTNQERIRRTERSYCPMCKGRANLPIIKKIYQSGREHFSIEYIDCPLCQDGFKKGWFADMRKGD